MYRSIFPHQSGWSQAISEPPIVSPVEFLAHDLGWVSFNLSHFRGHHCQFHSTTQLRSHGITPGELSDSTQLPSTGKYSNTSLAFNWILSIRNNAFKRRMPQWEQSTPCTPNTSVRRHDWESLCKYVLRPAKSVFFFSTIVVHKSGHLGNNYFF